MADWQRLAHGHLEPLGRPAMFYFPAKKLDTFLESRRASVRQWLDRFLLANYGPYTTQRKPTAFGIWLVGGSVVTDKNVEYRVSFVGKERITLLADMLAQLAGETGEEAIYLETGEDAWLVRPNAKEEPDGKRTR